MNTPLLTPPSLSEPDTPRVRVTVPVTQEVLETFQRMAKASGLSVGRAMGDWLGDTIEAAAFMTQTMEKARAAPRIVAQELHAYALGLGDETQALLHKLRQEGRGRVRLPQADAPAPGTPRPVIRGGKSPVKTRSPVRGRSGPRGES